MAPRFFNFSANLTPSFSALSSSSLHKLSISIPWGEIIFLFFEFLGCFFEKQMTFLTVPFLQWLPSLLRTIPCNVNLLSVYSEEQPIGPVQPQFKALKKALSSETFNSVLIWLSFLTKYFICFSLLWTST